MYFFVDGTSFLLTAVKENQIHHSRECADKDGNEPKNDLRYMLAQALE
jgi:hypothetical protein